jgi:hypothetical protein
VGNPERVTYGNALQTDITRDLLYRATRQDIVNASPQVAFDYTLDPTGRRLSMTDADGRSADYSYDDTYKLTREDVTGEPARSVGCTPILFGDLLDEQPLWMTGPLQNLSLRINWLGFTTFQ